MATKFDDISKFNSMSTNGRRNVMMNFAKNGSQASASTIPTTFIFPF